LYLREGGRALAGPRRMSPKQRRFAEEYLVDLNATQAALRAGYSKGCAGTHSLRLLRRPDVAAFVAEAQAARAERIGLTADRVVNELAKVAFGDPRGLFTWGEKGVALRDSGDLTRAEAALVSEISESHTASGGTTRHIKLHGKMAALMALGKHLGLFSGPLKPPGDRDDANPDDDEGQDARERLARRIAGIAARLETERGAGGDTPD